MAMINTVLADDHKLFCEGLERLLNETEQFRLLATFYNGTDLLNEIEQINPDLVLLDLEMPGMHGLEVIHRVRAKNPATKIIVLSMHEENVYSKEAHFQGADGYLPKSIESQTLVESILRVYNGDKVFPKFILDKPEGSLLSARELDILKLVAEGKTSDNIAAMLRLSELTVKTHRRNIMNKLNVNNTAELIRLAIDRGLI